MFFRHAKEPKTASKWAGESLLAHTMSTKWGHSIAANATQRESHEMSTPPGKKSTFSAARVNLFSTEIKRNLLITDYLRVYRSLTVASYGYQCFTRSVLEVKVNS